jgi:hemoglobin
MTAPINLNSGPTSMQPLYDRIGSSALHELVTRFYSLVAEHPLLAPIFPADLTLTAHKQEAFLSGFLGGPPLYQQEFGHPRLRMRHLPFPITPARARAWLGCMGAALDATPSIERAEADELLVALSRGAAAMINTPEENQ